MGVSAGQLLTQTCTARLRQYTALKASTSLALQQVRPKGSGLQGRRGGRGLRWSDVMQGPRPVGLLTTLWNQQPPSFPGDSRTETVLCCAMQRTGVLGLCSGAAGAFEASGIGHEMPGSSASAWLKPSPFVPLAIALPPHASLYSCRL